MKRLRGWLHGWLKRNVVDDYPSHLDPREF